MFGYFVKMALTRVESFGTNVTRVESPQHRFLTWLASGRVTKNCDSKRVLDSNHAISDLCMTQFRFVIQWLGACKLQLRNKKASAFYICRKRFETLSQERSNWCKKTPKLKLGKYFLCFTWKSNDYNR